MDRYAVVGHPVAHSKSPFIHGRFANQLRADISYVTMDVAPQDFEREVQRFFDDGGKGLNITLPHKERAWQLSQWRSDSAERSGAVNTLHRDENGTLCGHNTDGIGLVRDITRNHAGRIAGRRILLLGAGGAVRGVMPALIGQQPQSIVIANRTLARADALAQHFDGEIPVRSSAFEALPAAAHDLVINGTSAGLSGAMPELPDGILAEAAWCYDMVYAKGETVFQRWAIEHGAAMALDGCGMLVEQAAQSFYIWRGQMPGTTGVIASLRQSLT